jgi:hypothetical protein
MRSAAVFSSRAARGRRARLRTGRVVARTPVRSGSSVAHDRRGARVASRRPRRVRELPAGFRPERVH